jgi:hypothetical protein
MNYDDLIRYVLSMFMYFYFYNKVQVQGNVNQYV